MNSINDKLCKILSELGKLSTCREEVLFNCITDRVKKSEEAHNEVMNYAKYYLSTRNPVKVLKMINRRKNKGDYYGS